VAVKIPYLTKLSACIYFTFFLWLEFDYVCHLSAILELLILISRWILLMYSVIVYIKYDLYANHLIFITCHFNYFEFCIKYFYSDCRKIA